MATVEEGASDDIVWPIMDAHEPARFVVRMYCPTDGNLSLDGMYRDNTATTYKEYLARILASQNIRTVYEPAVYDMSAAIGDHTHFNHITRLSCHVLVRRASIPCDGVQLRHHESAIISPGGCPVLVLTFRGTSAEPMCLVAHAGRESLIDTGLIHTGMRSRPEFSIVDALVSYGQLLGGHPEHMHLRIFGAIPWQAFRHSARDVAHGERNSVLLSYLAKTYGADVIQYSDDGHEHLCLETIVERQAIQAEVGTIHAHGHGLPLDGPFPYTTHSNPKLAGSMRYLCVVTHQ